MPQVLKRWILLPRLKYTNNSLQSHSQRWGSEQEWECVGVFFRESKSLFTMFFGEKNEWERERGRKGACGSLNHSAAVCDHWARSVLNKNFLVRKENCWLRSNELGRHPHTRISRWERQIASWVLNDCWLREAPPHQNFSVERDKLLVEGSL